VVAAHVAVRGVAAPVVVVVVAVALRGAAAVAVVAVVVDAEVRAAAADDLKFDGRHRFGGVFLSGRQA
jgi:hypothetical protein